MEWEKPEDAEDLLARVTVILLLTAVIAGVLVGGVMYLLFDAPVWGLAVGVVVIAACITRLAFAPEVEVPEEIKPWERQRPVGTWGWLKFGGSAFAAWFGLCLIVNKVILDLLLGASDSAQGITALVMLPLAIVLELYLGGD